MKAVHIFSFTQFEEICSSMVRFEFDTFHNLALEEKEKHHSLDDKFTQGQDGSFLSLGNLKERFRQIRRSARFTHHPTVKRPGRLHIVSLR